MLFTSHRITVWNKWVHSPAGLPSGSGAESAFEQWAVYTVNPVKWCTQMPLDRFEGPRTHKLVLNRLLPISHNVLEVCEIFSLEPGIVSECQGTSHFHWPANGDTGPGWKGEGDDYGEGRRAGRAKGRLVEGKGRTSLTMAGTRALLMLENFVDGKFLPCDSYLDSYDPSTGEVYCQVPDSGKAEVSEFSRRGRKCPSFGDLCPVIF